MTWDMGQDMEGALHSLSCADVCGSWMHFAQIFCSKATHAQSSTCCGMHTNVTDLPMPRSCGERGATVGCRVERCPCSYHLACAKSAGAQFNPSKFVIACPTHKAHFKGEPNSIVFTSSAARSVPQSEGSIRWYLLLDALDTSMLIWDLPPCLPFASLNLSFPPTSRVLCVGGVTHIHCSQLLSWVVRSVAP